MVEIAILGHGVVGSGVLELLFKNKDIIKERAGSEIALKKVLDVKDFEGSKYSSFFTKNFDDVLEDEGISIVVETIGGLVPSYDFVKRLLLAGKSVVTSNKELVCKKGYELLNIAKENNVNFLFEASVGGGMPIVDPLRLSLSANHIEKIEGILNGTTNFILTKMEEGLSFNDSLRLAQSLGYAEKDPSDDIKGIDSCRKICILGGLLILKQISPKFVRTIGIDNIDLADVLLAKSFGLVLKLVAIAKFFEGEVEKIEVCPCFLEKTNKLYFIDGVLNGVVVKGDAVGEVLFVGEGAGKFPTASAVLADVISIVRNDFKNISVVLKENESDFVLNKKKDLNKFYLRFKVNDIEVAKDFILKNYNSPTFLEGKEKKKEEVVFKTDLMEEENIEFLEEKLKEKGIKQEAKFKIL